MAVIDFVKWDGDSSVLAWKFPSQELSTWTQLIVNETQDAYLVKEGVYQGPFGPGRHTLSTENIPLLRNLIGIPFGGKSPFTAEIWYVNRISNLNVLWGTPDPIQLQDPKYQVMIPVRAFGQYGIRIVDPKKFLLKLVGTLPSFDINTLSDYFKGEFITKIKTGIAKAIIENGKSVLEVSTELETLSSMLKQSLTQEMDDYGVGLAQFNIHSINVPEDDSAVVSLKAALAKRAEMGLLGFTYQQERSLDVLQTAAGNDGSAGSVMGAGMGMGMGMGLGVGMGGAFSQLTPQIQAGINQPTTHVLCMKCNASNPIGTKFCGSCGGTLVADEKEKKLNTATCYKCATQIPKNSKFCPNCAEKINICSECGENNPTGSLQCRGCGKSIPSACSNCNAEVPRDAKFCPECGNKSGRSCVKCGNEVVRGAKFCNNCGEPQSYT